MRVCLVFIVVTLSIMQGFSQIGGSSSYSFLGMPVSARTTGLGSYAPNVLDRDLSNAYQNPSLLNAKMHNQWTLNVCNSFADSKYGYFATAYDLKKYGTVSMGVHYQDYGDFTARDVVGNEVGSFKANESAFVLGYGRAYEQFRIGTNVKFLFSNIESYQSSAIALDLSGSYTDSASGLGLSFILLNIGTQTTTFANEKEPLPFEAIFSASKRLKHAPFRFTLTLHNLQKFDLTYNDPNNSSNQIDLSTGEAIATEFSFADKLMRHVAVGTEVLLSENFQLRVGYNHQRRREMALDVKPGAAGFSWGFGMKIKKVGISYGAARYHLAASTNMFSLSVNPNDFVKKKKSS